MSRVRTDSFKNRIDRLEGLRKAGDGATLTAAVTDALDDVNNYVIAKAAAIASESVMVSLAPRLLAAYRRLFEDGASMDPGCLGKNAIARALKDLGHADPAPFLSGLRYVQMEPVWGKSIDTAATLRGTCAHALVACDIEMSALLEQFVDLLADPEKEARVEAVRAIEALGGEGVLLLRLKALCSDPEPEVIGECFRAILHRQHGEAVPFVARFTESDNLEIQLEAVSALAASRELDALDVVKHLWPEELSTPLRRAIIFSCGESPLPEAADFLLSLVDARHIDLAAIALTALADSRFKAGVRERAFQAAEKANDPGLMRSFEKAFS